MHRTVLTIMALAFFGVQVANATVTLGFEINSIEDSPLFQYNTNGSATVTDDTLTADNSVSFTVKVNGVAAPTFENAKFVFDADLVSYANNGVAIFLGFSGTFSVYTSTNDLILSAVFEDASTVMFNNGAINTNLVATANEAPAIYTPGSALYPHLPASSTLTPPQTMNFTVQSLMTLNEEVQLEQQLNVGSAYPIFSGSGLGDGELDTDYTFDSSFSGTSEIEIIPEPTSLALLLAGIAFMGHRPRREA